MVRSSCMKSVTELDTPGKSLCKVSMIVVFMVFKSHTNCWIIQVLRLKHTDPQMTLHPVIFCMHFSLLYWNTKKTIIGIRPESKWTVKTRTVEICCLLVVNSETDTLTRVPATRCLVNPGRHLQITAVGIFCPVLCEPWNPWLLIGSGLLCLHAEGRDCISVGTRPSKRLFWCNFIIKWP